MRHYQIYENYWNQMNSNHTYRNLKYWKNPDFFALLYFLYTIDIYDMDQGHNVIFGGEGIIEICYRPSKGSTDMTSD